MVKPVPFDKVEILSKDAAEKTARPLADKLFKSFGEDLEFGSVKTTKVAQSAFMRGQLQVVYEVEFAKEKGVQVF